MLAPNPIVQNPSCLLADIRMLLSPWPELVDYPECLAVLLDTDERDVRAALETLDTLDAEVLG